MAHGGSPGLEERPRYLPGRKGVVAAELNPAANRASAAVRLWPRRQVYFLNRAIVCAVVAASLGGLLYVPDGPLAYAVDVLARTWLVFAGTVMAHEGTHRHLGRTRRANLWWGRLALVPSMVPYSNFRKTHLLHHRYTNHPDRDPDRYIKPDHEWELPLRAIGMPHHWFVWLYKRGEVNRAHMAGTLLNYAGIACFYLPILWVVGWGRLLAGMLPVLVLASLLLWYPFAYLTHEGFSVGGERTRSHDYYGSFAYWLSLGLSMHRVHHLSARFSWIELRQFVKKDPSGRFAWWPRRDIQPDAPSEAV